MSFGHLLGSFGISNTGMRAERLRMELIANNIANADSRRWGLSPQRHGV